MKERYYDLIGYVITLALIGVGYNLAFAPVPILSYFGIFLAIFSTVAAIVIPIAFALEDYEKYDSSKRRAR